MVNMNQIDNKLALDVISAQNFIRLAAEDRWTEEDLDQFVSTEGMQYLIEQEKESGPNFSENAVKTFLRRVYKGFSKEQGGWEISWKEKSAIPERLDHLLKKWDDFVGSALSVMREYMPLESLEATTYILPGGFKESYSSSQGVALNVGHGEKTDTQWIFFLTREIVRFWIIRTIGEKHIKDCKTPSEFVEAFLDNTQREGMALLVGLKAAGSEEEFMEACGDLEKKKKMYSKAFQLALEGRAPKEIEWINEVFSGFASPSALMGFSMAKALDESEKYMGHALGKDMLRQCIGHMGHILFFELYKPYEYELSLFPEIVWDAFTNIKKEKGIGSVGEGFFPGL
jgi:hypothetical protein